MEREPIDNRRIGGDEDRLRGDGTAIRCGDNRTVVTFFDLLHNGLGVKHPAYRRDDRGEAFQIFQRMEGRLSRIAQGMLLLASLKRHADKPVHGCADPADRVDFLVNDLRVGIERLKQIAVEPAKIAFDLFQLLNLFNAVHCRGLAFIERARYFLAAQIDHRRGQIVA